MAEVGLSFAEEFPKPVTDEVVADADVIVTMGCGDACPVLPGKRYADWPVDDPSGKSLADVRIIREDIRQRVLALLSELDLSPDR
jgi:protein-tyrosine-phosphatase